MSRYKYSATATLTIIIAVIFAVVGAFVVIRGAQILPPEFSDLVAFIGAASFGTAIITAVYVGVNVGIVEKIRNPLVDHRSLLAEVALLQSLSIMFYNSHGMSQIVLYAIVSALHVWTTWLAFGIAADGLRIQESFLNRTKWVACLSIAFFALIGWGGRSFWIYRNILLSITIWQALVHIGALIFVLGWFAFKKKHRLDKKSLKQSLVLRLNSEDKPISEWHTSILSALLQLAISTYLFVVANGPEGLVNKHIIFSAPVLFIPALIVIWSKLDRLGTNLDDLSAYKRLTGRSAQKMMGRLGNTKAAWAASIGVRTSTFTIDHDPNRVIGNRIPATLLIIRNEELLSYVGKLTRNLSLSLSSASQKITGALDPEFSARPVVDALNLCAAIYLDANNLVERRLNGLISLLPIINPGLSNVTQSDQMMPILKNINTFYHCDFTWVDQSIVATTEASRYAINLSPISPGAFLEMLNLMRQNHSSGSYLWISKEAHNRLLHEAPGLVSIMTAHTIKVDRENDLLIFSAKFEQLIPRLQLHFALDTTRAMLLDHELRAEAKHLLSIYALEIQNSTKLPQLLTLTDSITAYSWRGFKEKDKALSLLLKIYNSAKEFKPENTSIKSDVPELLNAIRNSIIQIGYPSQLISQAQQNKQELRDLDTISLNALNPASDHFKDAWVHLGSIEFFQFSEEQIQSCRNIVTSAIKNREIAADPVVQAKMINFVVGLIRSSSVKSIAKDGALLISVIETLITYKASADTMSLALDALTFIASLDTGALTLSYNITTYFESTLKRSGSPSTAWEIALWGRWQEYRTKHLKASLGNMKVS